MSPPIAVSSPRSQHADASPAARIDANSDGTTQIHARITGDADSDSRATSGWSVNQDEGVDGSRANLLGDDGDARENADTLARRRAQLRVQVGRAEATLQESPRRGGETGQQRVDAGAGVGRIADTGGNARQQTQKSAQLALGDATRPADVAAAGVSQTQLAAPPHNPSALPSPPTASKLTPPPLPSAYTKKEKRHACYRPPAFKRSDISSFAYHLGPYTDLAYDPSWHADALVVEPDQLRAWVETAVAAQKEKSTLSNRPPTMTVAIPSNPVIDLDLTKHDSTAPEGPRTPLSGLSFARPKEDPPRRGLTVSLGSPSRRGHTGASPGASLHHDDDSSEDEDFPSPSRSQNPLTMVARAISRRATSKIPEGSTAMSRGMSSSAVKGSDLLRSPRISSPLGRKSFQRGRSPIEEDDEDSDSDDHQPSSAPGQVTRPPRLPGASLPLWVQPPPARAHTTSAAANASSLLTPLSSPPSADSFLPSPLHLTTGANVATISPSTPAPSTTLRLPVPTMLFLVSVSALLPRRKLAAALTSAPSVSPLNPRAVLGVLLRDAYVSAPGKVVDVVRRVGQASGWQVPVFLECQQGDGGDGFDRCARVVEMCREEVGGVVLWDACVVVGEDFTPVPRPPWGPSKAPLARLLRLLTTESSLRSSFLAVSATHTRGVPLPPALERHRLRWATERGFVQWAAGGRGERVEDMPRGTVRKVHDTDVFEWCAEPAALAVRAKAEKAWRAPPPPPVPGGAGPGLVKVRTAVGKHFPDAASFLARLDAAGCNVVVQPQAPAAPTWAAVHDAAVRVAQGTADPPLNEIAAGVVRVHSGCHPAPASPGSGPGVVVSVGHLVGTTACPALTARVAGRVFEAMTRLEERGLLAGFKVDQDVPTKDDPIRKEFRDTVGALGRVAESAWVAKVREVTESAAGGGVLGAVLAGAVEEIVEAAGRLKEDLDAGRWVVWTAGRAGFRVHDEAEVEGGGARVWGVAGRKADGVVGVYISDAHPHPAEILFNLYLQHNHNLSPHSAIAGESAMASLLTPPTRSLTDPSLFPIPTRVALEMTTSGPPELTSLCALLYARNRIIVSDTTGDAALKAITMTVHDRAAVLAGFELDERTEYKRALMEMASGEYRPASEFERRLGEEVGEASLETGGRERFLNLVGTVGELLNDSDPTVVRSAAAVYLSLWKACRRLAWEELKVALRCKNARYLPDCDQVAVAMEMTTTQGNLIGVFECTSLELAKVMSEKLRQEAKKDEVPEEIEEEGRRDEFSFVDGGKDLFNSFVFVYPIILDLLLVSFFGSGIFYTDQLDSTMENNISITLLVCFPVMGALSNSVARSSTAYIYSKSFPVFYELLAQKLSMIFIVSLVTSVAVGAPFAAVYGVRELLIIPYAFFFMLFMVLFGTLLLLRDTSRLFFLSEGPQAVVVGVVALLVAPVVTITALQSASTVVVLLVYIGSLILSDGFMLYKLFAMSKDLIEWPSRLDVPKESAIATIFEKKLPKPTLWMGEDVMEHQKRVRLWERSAREYYAAKVETYLNQTLPGLHPLVAERCEQWKLESPLMNWYLEMTGISHPPRFGKEWDSILGQAIVKLKAKYQADKLNRGDLLFSIEAPAILFGALYFFFIFIDRWGNLLGRGVTSVFGKLVSSDSATKAEDVAYMTGIRYGTLFILLGSGFLEIALLRLYASEKVGKEVRLSKEVSPDLLLSEYKAKARLEYLKELSIFVAELLFVFGLVSLIGMKSIFESTSTLYAFWLATIGYFGLLVGLFHKLILRGENYLNVGVSVIVALGIALSAITLRFTGNRLYQLLVSAVACWAFAGITAYFSHRESAFHRRGFRLSPSLNTSGYKRIGKPLNDLILERLNKLSQKLDRQKGKLRRLVPASPEVAARVLERAKPTGGGMDGPLQILEHQAFPNLFEQLSAATTDYRTDKVLVYMAPEKMRKEFEELGVFAIASLVPVPQGSQEHIAEIFAIIPKGCEFPENYVMEVVVHEYLECVRGYSHLDSLVAGHILFSESNQLPSATILDLQGRSVSELQKLHCNTDVKFAGCLDRATRILSGARGFSRRVVNQLIGPDTTKEGVLASQPADAVLAARHLLSGRVTLSIGLITADFGPARPNKSPSSSPVSPIETLIAVANSPKTPTKNRLTIDTFLLLVFLAIIGDPRFGRELSAAGIWLPVRFILWLFYKVSYAFSMFFKTQFVYRRLEDVQTIRRRANGLQRVYYLQKPRFLRAKRSDPIRRCDFFDFPNKNVISLRDQKVGEGFDFVYSRYRGPKPQEWQPSTKDKPISQAYFDNQNRLLWETIMDGGGEARETWVYGYSSKIAQVPKSRTIYTGPFDATYLLRARDPQESQSWKETQEFFARTGQVFKATIRVDKGTSTKQLQASYSYSTEEDSEEWPLIESAEYRASDENWVLTTQLSRGWRPDSGTAPKFAMVEYKEPNELYRVRFDYSHPQHTKFDCVRIDSSGNETMVPPPPFIMNDKYGLLRRPPPLTFHSSNEMLTVHYSPRMVRSWGYVKKIEFHGSMYSTPRIREELWASWRSQKVPGAIARTFDLDLVLRRERVLRSYFRSRDLGDLHGSEVALQAKKGMLDIILSVPDTPETRSSSMHVRLPDLKELATGGDSSLVASQTDDSPDVLKVVAVDSGTFPTGGGGVGSCRRDLINYLQRVRWTCLAELGTAEVAQREYQLEKHIEAIFYLTLWDLDFGNPNENFHRSVSGVDLEMRRLRATPQAIRDGFVPLIRTLVRAIFDNHLCASKVPVYEAVFVQIHEFCQVHDWTFSWESNSSIDAFIAEVLELCDTATRQGSALAIESPNLHEIGLAYSLITKMLLPLSTALPEFPDKRPCFHTSHHGVQAIVGVVAKSLTGATLVVWDHGILWRERLFALCDTDEMPRFVQIAFAGLTRLIAWLVMQRADAINSCTSIQNPMWEAHLGGAKFEDLDTKAMLQSKISPVVNGMNVARFKPNSELELPTPTAVMLSHISPVKDVVNAIEATNVIVNTFGLKNFTLHVYGSPEKDPAYTAECTSLIASYNLQKHVLLKGLGNPGAVLPTGWVFVNSSITEGLPLALGEAGLCGLPVVCTDVGGSREVISDLGTGVVYGAIAPPSRPRQLAQAILAVLAMTDGLESVVEQTSPSSGSSLSVRDFVARGAEGVNELEARITSESTKALRRKMGLMLRERTIQKFSINKYWRVHEQMLYLGSAYTPWLKVHKKRPTISAVPS